MTAVMQKVEGVRVASSVFADPTSFTELSFSRNLVHLFRSQVCTAAAGDISTFVCPFVRSFFFFSFFRS